MMTSPTTVVLPATMSLFDPAIACVLAMPRPPEALWIAIARHRVASSAAARLGANLRSRGVDAIPIPIDGKPGRALVELAAHTRADLLVAATDADDRTELADGSNATDLLRASACPVWLTGDSSLIRAKRILAAVRPPSTAAARDDDSAVVATAAALARHWGAELHLVIAWNPFGGRSSIRYVAGERLRAARDESRGRAIDGLVELATAHGVARDRVHLRSGDASIAVTAMALDLDADAIAVGARGRRGVAALLRSNTVERVARAAATAVIGVPLGATVALPRAVAPGEAA